MQVFYRTLIGQRLWEDYQAFAARDLSEHEIVYLFVDGTAERVRPGQRREPVLVTWSFAADGRKLLLHLMTVWVEDGETVSLSSKKCPAGAWATRCMSSAVVRRASSRPSKCAFQDRSGSTSATDYPRGPSTICEPHIRGATAQTEDGQGSGRLAVPVPLVLSIAPGKPMRPNGPRSCRRSKARCSW